MTPEELAQLRARYDLTFAALARLLGVKERTVYLWQAGKHRIPARHIARLLRLRQDLERIRQAAAAPCPACRGTGWADPPRYLRQPPTPAYEVVEPRKKA